MKTGMRRRVLSTARDQRGTAVLLALGFMVLLLALAGFAVDLAYQFAATGEAQRSVEAAALAGAGNLGFSDWAFDADGVGYSIFGRVRDAARDYAGFNPYHNASGGRIDLDRNPGNGESGSIVLGVWNGGAFKPSLDGSEVNAVRCQWSGTIPTAFLRVIGIPTLPFSAQAIAIANPPEAPPQNMCLFPVGATSCFFGGATSAGCGATLTFISSSDASAVGVNSAAWVSLTACPDCGVNANATRNAVIAAGAGGCPPSLRIGDVIGAQNGMAQSVYDTAYDVFVQKYDASPVYTVYGRDGQTVAYQGKGWEVFIPVIDTPGGCPPGPVNGDRTVVGFSRVIIAQINKQNGDCAVKNHWPGNPWDQRCFANKNGTAPPGSKSVVQGSRGIFGFYDCKSWPAAATKLAAPRTALATRLRLVKTY